MLKSGPISSSGCRCSIRPSLIPSRQASFVTTRSRSCRAASSNDRQIPLYPGSIQRVPINALYALEAALLVAELGLVDAAYSGDWSRIGVISQEQEIVLQQAVVVVAAIHSIEGLISAAIASSKNLNPAVAFVQGFFFGALGIWDTYNNDTQEAAAGSKLRAGNKAVIKAAAGKKAVRK